MPFWTYVPPTTFFEETLTDVLFSPFTLGLTATCRPSLLLLLLLLFPLCPGLPLPPGALLEDTVNHTSGERSFADVDYNFPMSDEEKRALMGLLERFFVDGELGEEGMEIYPTLSAVRFLRTEGELFETEA